MRDHGGQSATLFREQAPYAPKPWIDASTSISPCGLPPRASLVLQNIPQLLSQYPESDADSLNAVLANVHGIPSQNLICGNGSTDCMVLAVRASGAWQGVVEGPHWSGYAEICAAAGIPLRLGTLSELQDGEIFFVACPNNPDGRCMDPLYLQSHAKKNPDQLILIDLAFDDFLHDPMESPWWQGEWPDNIVRVKSLTKFFALPGVRLGFLVAQGALRKHAEPLRLPWQVNSLALALGYELYQDMAWCAETRRNCHALGKELVQILESQGLQCQQEAAWILAKHPQIAAPTLFQQWLQQGFCVRLWTAEDVEFPLRIGILSSESLQSLRAKWSPSIRLPSKCESILIAGTTSDAGKSAIATGLCALLAEQGKSVLPYKAQNMSNQAWVTSEGGEIGWSQAMQALACGVEPHVDMNPILLKPGSELKSHVVVQGVDQGAFSVHEYYQHFDQWKRASLESLDRLRSKAETVILEGAGGIAEINLRHRDLSNREAPLHAHAKTLLVGDIERGGVFASLYGSWACLDTPMRQNVTGFIINRFRGDASLLQNGIAELEERTGIPVLGVIPWQGDLGIGQEDSMGIGEDPLPPTNALRVGIVKFPHLSNANDFAPLAAVQGVRVFYSTKPEMLRQADVLILPGTRSTISDLQWLQMQGIDEVVRDFYQSSKPLLAICGGWQMLGLQIDDPNGVEGTPQASHQSLGLIPMVTTMQSQGKVVQARSHVISNDMKNQYPWLQGLAHIRGYEIHCGQSVAVDNYPHGEVWLDGFLAKNAMLWTTYWHGIFHDTLLAQQWLTWVSQAIGKPLAPTKVKVDSGAFWTPGIHKVRRMVGEHLQWKALWT